jgi:4a-hydroxytetrahydrobiopterin dehydratase
MNLAKQHCNAISARTQPSAAEARAFCATLPDWELQEQTLVKTFLFANYFETMAFVNALAWIAHQENHHPDLEVHYNRVRVVWSTHDSASLTLNDFICAARCQSLSVAD